jgi:hypothetical protein
MFTLSTSTDDSLKSDSRLPAADLENVVAAPADADALESVELAT